MSGSKSKVFMDGPCHGNIWTAGISYLFLTCMGIHTHMWILQKKRGISGFAKGKELLPFPASKKQNSYLKTEPLSSVKQAPRAKEGAGTLVTMDLPWEVTQGKGMDRGKSRNSRDSNERSH